MAGGGGIMTTEADLLRFLKPPLELLTWLEKRAEKQPLPAAVWAYLERWQALYAGLPVPGLDDKKEGVTSDQA